MLVRIGTASDKFKGTSSKQFASGQAIARNAADRISSRAMCGRMVLRLRRAREREVARVSFQQIVDRSTPLVSAKPLKAFTAENSIGSCTDCEFGNTLSERRADLGPLISSARATGIN